MPPYRVLVRSAEGLREECSHEGPVTLECDAHYYSISCRKPRDTVILELVR